MKRAVTRALLGVACIVLCGCDVVEDRRTPPPTPDDGEPQVVDTEDVVHLNEGDLCIYADDNPAGFLGKNEPQAFEAGSRLMVEVTTPECLSQTCDVDRHAACNVRTEPGQLTVTSILTYVDVHAPQCTLDCGRLIATCESEPLEEGVYEIVHGENIAELTVPSTVAPCSGDIVRPRE